MAEVKNKRSMMASTASKKRHIGILLSKLCILKRRIF